MLPLFLAAALTVAVTATAPDTTATTTITGSSSSSTQGPALLLVVFLASCLLSTASTLLVMRSCFPFWGRTTSKLREAGSFVATTEEVKLTLVVRKDLKMGTGKIAAQCAHAAVAVVEEVIALREQQQFQKQALDEQSALWVQWYGAWRISGCQKIALQCPDEEAMLAVAGAARELGLPFYVIRDAGRTQIAAGSKTVVAVGPGPKSFVDQVTGHLKLL